MPVLNLKTLFFIDGLGATITSFLLMAVLRAFEEYFGMPADILVILSIIALIFAIYSFSCFALYDKTSPKFLVVIIVANSLYCLLTSGLIISYFKRLTLLGLTYFIIEIIILCGLIYVELKTFKARK